MSSQSQAKSPERLRAMVAGTLANFQHPTLKHNLTTLKALHCSFRASKALFQTNGI